MYVYICITSHFLDDILVRLAIHPTKLIRFKSTRLHHDMYIDKDGTQQQIFHFKCKDGINKNISLPVIIFWLVFSFFNLYVLMTWHWWEVGTRLNYQTSSYTTESLRSCFHFQNTIPLKPVYRDLSFQKHLAAVLLKIIICVLSYCAFIWVPSNSIMYNQTLLGTESTKSCCSWYHSNWSQ